jgi:murein DD-endopeptidase MepM/ murein hydrolase activator NlpD
MSQTRLRGAVPLAIFVAFIAGIAVDSWLRTYGPPRPAAAATAGSDLTLPDTFIAAPAKAPAKAPPPVATPGDVPRGRLRMPLDGEDVESLKGGFAETRGGDRPHEAVDMLAPRNTPVHAVDGGSIAKLFTSKAGGLTIYQFDPGGRVCYYYAHLERYADGLKDGQMVSQGDVIGYVGTTGNAPPNTPHLHFAVFELNADKRWWQGRAIDPYRVFKDRG